MGESRAGDADTDLLLIDAGALPPEFFDLRSGFAGEFVRKLANYRVRTAAVFSQEAGHSERFREFVYETRRSEHFRGLDNREDALAWLAESAR